MVKRLYSIFGSRLPYCLTRQPPLSQPNQGLNPLLGRKHVVGRYKHFYVYKIGILSDAPLFIFRLRP